MPDTYSKYHFIAIGGVGQSALAKILLKRGYSVSGSDIKQGKYTKELETLGAEIHMEHSEKNVPNDALVVVSSAIKKDNPEYQKALDYNLKILHRSDMLKEISDMYGCFIGFSGTHGKTTTSGLMSFLLSKAQKKPSFAIGGIIPGLETNADAFVDSPYFIAELDESDGTIIKYSPDITVVNNLEADHLDFYKNGLCDVINTFTKFLTNLKDGSKVLINADDIGCKNLMENNPDFNFITYGIESDKSSFLTLDYRAANIREEADLSEFDVYKVENYIGKIQTSLKGKHNIYNVLAVVSALFELNLKLEDFASYIPGFSGMGRRFEQVYKDDNIEIIDDYAHHPTEIKATLKAAKVYSKGRRIVAVFQPHRYTRLKALWDEFIKSFKDCDLLIVSDVYSAGDKHDELFNSKNFTDAVEHNNAVYIEGSIDKIGFSVKNYIKENDLILTIGAGDITKLSKDLKGALCAK